MGRLPGLLVVKSLLAGANLGQECWSRNGSSPPQTKCSGGTLLPHEGLFPLEDALDPFLASAALILQDSLFRWLLLGRPSWRARPGSGTPLFPLLRAQNDVQHHARLLQRRLEVMTRTSPILRASSVERRVIVTLLAARTQASKNTAIPSRS